MLQNVNLAFIQKRLDAYERLIRLDKPIGILLLLWPTLWAVWIAGNGWPLVLQPGGGLSGRRGREQEQGCDDVSA